MKSVGEAMAIGRNFTEALQKALRSLERTGSAFHWDGEPGRATRRELLEQRAGSRPTAGSSPCSRRCAAAPPSRRSHDATGIDPWFLDQIALINEVADRVAARRAARPPTCCGWPSGTASPTPRSPRCAGMPEAVVRGVRHALGVRPVYKTVDTCAAEFAAHDAVPLLAPTTRRTRSRRASGPR